LNTSTDLNTNTDLNMNTDLNTKTGLNMNTDLKQGFIISYSFNRKDSKTIKNIITIYEIRLSACRTARKKFL